MMNGESYVFSLPLLTGLGTLINWMLLANALLIAALVFFAHKSATHARRAAELQSRLDAIEAGDIDPLDAPITVSPIPLSDDRPIPLVRAEQTRR